MDFIKNLFSHFHKIDSKDQTTEDRVFHDISIDDVQEPADIKKLITSQSSDEINDSFTKDFDVSPDNPKETEVRVIKDDVVLVDSGLTCISIDAVNNNDAQSILREETVLNLDDFFEDFDETSNIVDANDSNEKERLKENETQATAYIAEVSMLNSDDFDKTSIKVSKNVDIINRNGCDKLKENTPFYGKNIEEPVLNLHGCNNTLSKFETVIENPTGDNNKKPDINLDNCDKTLSEVSKTVDSKQHIRRLKNNLASEEQFLNLSEIFGTYDDAGNCNDSKESKNLFSENKDTEPMRVVGENMEVKTDSVIPFSEFEDIFKYCDVKAVEKVREVENSQLPNLDETIEDTNNTYASMTEVPVTNNITLTQLEVGHNLNNINTRSNLDINEFQPETTNVELTMPNYIDFEANLVKCVIFKADNSETINKTVKENQPIVLDESEQANAIGLFDINENNILVDDVIDLNDTMSNDPKAGAPMDIISISSTENEPDDGKNNDSDYCSGYNSSDFEFIDEEEAKLGGLVINCYNQELGTPKRSKTVHTLEIAKDPSYVSGSSPESVELCNRPGPSKARDNSQEDNRSGTSKARDNYQKDNRPGPSNARDNSQKDNKSGPSNARDNSQKDNRPGPSNARDDSQKDNRPGPSNATYNYQHHRHNIYFNPIDTSYRQNHVIPEGEEYDNLFKGMYAPFVSDLHFLENKSIRPPSCMNVQFRNIGFDTIGERREESDNEYTEEAEETAKKILSMYPGVNRKRRRRF